MELKFDYFLIKRYSVLWQKYFSLARVARTLQGSSTPATKRVTARRHAGAPSGPDVAGHSLSFPPCLPSCSVGVFPRACTFTAKRGRRSFKDGIRLWRHICFIFRRANMRPACLFNIATVSSRLSRSLYPYRAAGPLTHPPLHPPSLLSFSFSFSLSFSFSHAPRDVPVIPVCLTCFLSSLSANAIVPYTHTCSQRNNSLVHFLIYLRFHDNLITQWSSCNYLTPRTLTWGYMGIL